MPWRSWRAAGCACCPSPHSGANVGVSLTGTGVSAEWQLLRSKGILWYGFVCVFQCSTGENGGVLAGIVQPGAL